MAPPWRRPTTSPTPASQSSSNSLATAVIVGIVLGIVCLCLILILFCHCYRRYSRVRAAHRRRLDSNARSDFEIDIPNNIIQSINYNNNNNNIINNNNNNNTNIQVPFGIFNNIEYYNPNINNNNNNNIVSNIDINSISNNSISDQIDFPERKIFYNPINKSNWEEYITTVSLESVNNITSSKLPSFSNVFGGTSKGIGDKFWNKMEDDKINNSNSGSIMNECIVCMCEFDPNIKIAQLDCKHYFHKNCAMKWLLENPSCPMCRCPVTKK